MQPYNKFLQKRANNAYGYQTPQQPQQPAAPPAPAAPTQQPSTNNQGWFAQVKDRFDQAKLGFDLFGPWGLDRAQQFGDATTRLQSYQNGTAVKDYDPLQDMNTVSNIMESDEFQNNYTKWASNPANKSSKWYRQLADLNNNKRHAFRYAVRNPKDFRDAQRFRGFGVMDYLFGSTADNYNMLRIANGPLAGLLSPEKRQQLRSNYGLMKMIWRIKKFFSEFGNWQDVRDPEHVQ
jgi:hypothetical protein